MARRRINPCSYLPRRLQIVVSLALFVLLTILIFGSSSGRTSRFPEGTGLHFRAPAHVPPQQQDSTSGDVSWFSHWNWRNPFSASVAIDDRALLPVQAPRVAVYTYYETDQKKSKADRQAENELLLTWRRAWWAKGFKPIVLGRAEATQNPLYKQLQSLNLAAGLEADIMRWLAWGNMGNGILADWLAYPMCEYDNPLLNVLRSGQFPELTRYKELHNGFFAGQGKHVHVAVRSALSAHTPPTGDSLVEALPKSTFQVQPSEGAVALYSLDTIHTKYKSIYDILQKNAAKGWDTLRQLIEFHLQSVWQAQFHEGIVALRPIPESMTAVTEQAHWLAKNLSTCLDTPLASACPPNIPNCKPCMPSAPMPIKMPKTYINSSNLFTIGTVPHPYTMTNLIKKKITTSFKVIRRETKRDPYILAVSANAAMGTGRSSYDRLVYMKDAIASEHAQAHSLWMTAERKLDKAWRDDLHWVFGFPIPESAPNDGKGDSPVPGAELERRENERKGQREHKVAKMPDEKGIQLEHNILDESKHLFGKHRLSKGEKRLKRVSENWSMADTELWNFVRAFSAQRKAERERWEDEERRYAGSEKRPVLSGWFSEDE